MYEFYTAQKITKLFSNSLTSVGTFLEVSCVMENEPYDVRESPIFKINQWKDAQKRAKLREEKPSTVVNLELPKWALRALAREAKRQNLSRQALMRVWMIAKIDKLVKKRASL